MQSYICVRTNEDKLSGLKQHKFIPALEVKIKVLAGLHSFWGLWVVGCMLSCLLQLLETGCTHRLGAPSFVFKADNVASSNLSISASPASLFLL